MKFVESIESIHKNFIEQLKNSNTLSQLEDVRIIFLGRKGTIAALMKELTQLSVEEKRILGPKLNQLKQTCETLFDEKYNKIKRLQQEQENLKKASFDVTASYRKVTQGSLHPYTHIIQQIEDIFIPMGFEIADGPEVETDFYNFKALNIPDNHPARDMQDTMWLQIPQLLMRTQTSPIQIRAMQHQKPPIALLAHGRCYRNEATDASHDYMFMQTEGLFIDKGVSLAHLFATTQNFLQAIFEKKDLEIRVRPGYFPFVEPGVEIDMSCPFCSHGCSTCKQTRWIEICGAGLVHPNVLRYGGIDPSIYSGFAFGAGLTRLTMLKYKMSDIRLLSSLEVDVLKQF
ncbi:MAG TPA: phenylalanine--tRNA ligase subunit alpha [Candidatus Babeliales bacterium]|nr:phenylalanine--tRNA ligase subunit alpha [Candidatus Babeliales bacterium]